MSAGTKGVHGLHTREDAVTHLRYLLGPFADRFDAEAAALDLLLEVGGWDFRQLEVDRWWGIVSKHERA